MRSTVPPTRTPVKQRPPELNTPSQPFDERKLKPYFDDSIVGMELQPAQIRHNKPKSKPKARQRKQTQTALEKQASRKQAGAQRPMRSVEQAYHSENGTAHYLCYSSSRASSEITNTNPPYGVCDTTSTQPASTLTPTPTRQVYAGPNFLASPAASALPMPKAFTRGLPTVTHPETPCTQSVSPKRGLESPNEQVSSASAFSEREESPLDFLFLAHKAEKLRQTSHSASPLSTIQSPEAPRSAPRLHPSHPPNNGQTRSKLTNITTRQKLVQELDEVGEVDGESDTTDSDEPPPITSTYKQKINALRNHSATASNRSGETVSINVGRMEPDAFKQLQLAHDRQQPSSDVALGLSTPPTGRKAIRIDSRDVHSRCRTASPLRSPSPRMNSQQPQLSDGSKSISGQSPGNSDTGLTANIKVLEDSLRKYLNIGS